MENIQDLENKPFLVVVKDPTSGKVFTMTTYGLSLESAKVSANYYFGTDNVISVEPVNSN